MKTLVVFVFTFLTSANILAQTSEAAHVHIYRPHNTFYGNGMHPTFSCDYDVVAKVPNGSSFEVDLAPGKHLLHAAYGSFQADRPIELVAGRDYYLRLMVGGTPGGVMTGAGSGFQLIETTEAEAKAAMVGLKPLSADKVTPPAIETLAGAAAQRVAFARRMEDDGLRQGTDMSAVASGPGKTYLTVYMAVSKPILFQIGEDQASLDKIKDAGFTRFTVSDPSLRGSSPAKSLIGSALTGQVIEPGCNIAAECTRTWYF
jgi:hypothetical protein